MNKPPKKLLDQARDNQLSGSTQLAVQSFELKVES
jgi:hypothetical protein